VTAREVARRVLDRVDRGGAWATLTLDGELARSGLADRDRRLASELVYGVLRNRSRIDRAIAAHADLKRTPPRVLSALRVAVYQLVFLDRVPSYAAVDDAVTAARGIGGAKLGGFVNAVLRKIGAAGEPALPADPRERIAVEHSLPVWIVEELEASIAASSAPDANAGGAVTPDRGAPCAGGSRDAIDTVPAPSLADAAAAFAQPAPLVGRANRRVTTREAVIAELRAAGATAEPVALATEAIRIEGLGDPAQSPSFVAGRWTVQDAGAQRVGHLAAPRPGSRILDACAGVGGKATHLAELAGDAAAIDAADQSATKLGLLRDTAKRLGLASITTRVCDLLDPAAPLAPAYDLIVLDAPCTGLGVLRRHPDAKWRLVPDDVPRLAALQARLLDAVAARLAPGGTLVYSVCTFTRAEGPEQIRAFTARTGLALVSESRTWPPDADAFYIARLARG
jgi:16S rRNA (cytosine967-C5)-methyltransferase